MAENQGCTGGAFPWIAPGTIGESAVAMRLEKSQMSKGDSLWHARTASGAHSERTEGHDMDPREGGGVDVCDEHDGE